VKITQTDEIHGKGWLPQRPVCASVEVVSARTRQDSGFGMPVSAPRRVKDFLFRL
jgi:hypothetical protein